MSANILHLPPKRVTGEKRNVKWEMWYDVPSREWRYTVVVQMRPQVFSGSYATEAEARREVDSIMRIGVS